MKYEATGHHEGSGYVPISQQISLPLLKVRL
jgi:hypothetical protein